ncbi:hypothetical protein C1646_765003 [Rhizophagus diaphanus]|nr:hypothetical protein C1646_765003 [Rhizophagus diaphanus] [Rhizophagus sp. MUCL 43196]
MQPKYRVKSHCDTGLTSEVRTIRFCKVGLGGARRYIPESFRGIISRYNVRPTQQTTVYRGLNFDLNDISFGERNKTNLQKLINNLPDNKSLDNLMPALHSAGPEEMRRAIKNDSRVIFDTNDEKAKSFLTDPDTLDDLYRHQEQLILQPGNTK